MRFIIVGVGWAGERHARAVRALQSEGLNVEVAALVDADPEHLQRQARKLNVERTYRELAPALEAEPDAEAVIVATPHHLHRPHTERAAEAGRHVLVEKPMARRLEDADAMIAACQRAGVQLMVAESLRYDPCMVAVRRALQAGGIGQVLAGRINLIPHGYKTFRYPGRRSWLAQPESGGSGIWLLNGIHVMSAARMIFGEVESIHARTVASEQWRSELEATVVAQVRFDTGAVASLTVSAELHGYDRFADLAVFGAEGSLWCNWRKGSELHVYCGEEKQPEVIPCPAEQYAHTPEGFVRQLGEFVDAVQDDREPYTAGRDERETLAAVLAGYESAETGRPVEPG